MKELEKTQTVQQDNHLFNKVMELENRVKQMEDLLNQTKDTLTVEEAAKFMGMARSTLYKMTSENVIPFYRPNGKMIYFEKSVLTDWMHQNRVYSKTEIAEEATLHQQRLAKTNR